MLTPRQRQWKRRWLLLSILYFVAGYTFCAWVTQHYAIYQFHIFAWELSLPFLPEAIWAYLLPYPTILLTYVLIDDVPVYRDFVSRYFLIITIHFICYLILPMEMERPHITPGVSLAANMTQWYYSIDPPRNLLPSLHISLPLLCAISLWSYRRAWSWFVFGLVGMTAISVLLIKQHYAIDIIASFALVPILCALKPKTTCPTA